jgi:leader peptidase (prepilin peptidase)/N-methyltransferase
MFLLDLIPLLSQVALRARCRYCGAKISWRYFGIELLTAILFVLVGLQTGELTAGWPGLAWAGDPYQLLQRLIFVAALVVVFWIDYDTRLIQLEAVFLLGLAGVAYDLRQVLHDGKPLTAGGLFAGMAPLPAAVPESLWAMVVTATALWLMRELFSQLYGKEALGFGDVILVAAIAANLGWQPTLVTFFFLAVVVGASIGVVLQIPRALRAYAWMRQRERAAKRAAKSRALPLARHAFRKAIPFGPMLAAGAVAALLYGPRLNAAYMGWVNPGIRFPTATGWKQPRPWATPIMGSDTASLPRPWPTRNWEPGKPPRGWVQGQAPPPPT